MATVGDIGGLLPGYGKVDQSWVGFGDSSQTIYKAMPDAATIATDAAVAGAFAITLTGSPRTLANPTNVRPGTWLFWRLKQDATGSRAVVYGTAFKWPGGIPPSLSTAPNAVDHISGFVQDANNIECNILRDIR